MKYIITILLLVFPNMVSAQVFSLTYEDNTSNDKPTVTIGFIKGATDGIDAALGEKELPPLHPITGAHAVAIIDVNKDGYFSSAVDMFSYRDIRNTEPIRAADTFWIQVSPWKADKKWMKFSWDYPLGTGTDSVVLTDRGGALRVNCDSKKSHTILPNSFGVGQIVIEDFYVIVYRTTGISSIEDLASNQNVIPSDLYSSNGVMIATGIDAAQLEDILRSSPSGVYFIRSGTTISSRLNIR